MIDDEGLTDDNDGLCCTDDEIDVPGSWNGTNSRLYDSTGITAYWNSMITPDRSSLRLGKEHILLGRDEKRFW
jgi:hypothetical protein